MFPGRAGAPLLRRVLLFRDESAFLGLVTMFKRAGSLVF